MLSLHGKIVAITGASGGIGEATARLLAQRGATVVLAARRSERIDAIAQEVREQGGRIVSRKVRAVTFGEQTSTPSKVCWMVIEWER